MPGDILLPRDPDALIVWNPSYNKTWSTMYRPYILEQINVIILVRMYMNIGISLLALNSNSNKLIYSH